MTTQAYPWIRRQAADALYQKILEQPDDVQIYLLEASAGVGKTYLARDIGVRLGSESGYEPGNQDGVYWSGIIDLYDPEINSKRIEQLWIEAFGTNTRFEFDKYFEARRDYELSTTDAAMPPSEIEQKIDAIRTAFAGGLATITKDRYPVMALDTVERLQTILDPAQRAWNLELVEPPDVVAWLFHQLAYLPRGILLLMGRPAPDFKAQLEKQVQELNIQRKERGLKQVILNRMEVEYLSDSELEDFFAYRIRQNPGLKSLLDANKSLLAVHTQGNPLLLDIALQTLLETKNPELISQILKGVKVPKGIKGIKGVEEALLRAYMNQGDSERIMLMIYLAIARNGLSDELLEYLDPKNFFKLKQELIELESLPFIKTRSLSSLTRTTKQNGYQVQKTYFLHDEMYEICDRVKLVGPEQVRKDSKKIADWYDERIKQVSDKGIETRQSEESITDLMVESLPYRMRANPVTGYQWFLTEVEKAIRGAKRGLDTRLQSAISQFISSASDKGQAEGLPINPIDREILNTDFPDIHQIFKIDCTLLWLMRYSVRGRHEAAIGMAKRATWMEDAYHRNPERYFTTFIEFLLWWGQSLMYIAKSDESLEIYNHALKYIQETASFDEIKNRLTDDGSESQKFIRVCYLAGRFHNNRGYVYWYMGIYFGALVEFNFALQYFELAGLSEEIANTKDNRGRVFANLGYSFQAFEEVGDGLKKRMSAKLPLREALSRNSLAIVYARFGQFQHALEQVEEANRRFRRLQMDRGIALSLFTRGVTYRRLAREIEPWQNPLLSSEDALEYTEKAEADLREALRTFSDTVQETIRKIQILNELACCYRARYMLLRNKKNKFLNNEQDQKRAFERSKDYFSDSIKEAEKAHYLIDKIDSLQDRAVLYTYAKQFDEARKDIADVHKLIPDEYHIHEKDRLLPLDIGAQRVDAYYRLLGQAEALTAKMIFDENASEDNQNIGEEILFQVLEHYFLAAAYFNTFSSEAFLQNQTANRIYACLRAASPGFILAVRAKHLAAWLEKYNLPPEPIHSQFEGIFSTLLPEIRARGG
jgi:tetratricopeptide (TPR) repeat protein